MNSESGFTLTHGAAVNVINLRLHFPDDLKYRKSGGA
jgi:hypothetical protein